MEFHREPLMYVGHVRVNVKDIKRSVLFYQQIMGFKILHLSENKAIFSADGRTPLLTIEQPENVIPKQARTTGLYHFALLLPKRSDLALILEHFIQMKYPLQGGSDHLVSEALYLSDPDGNCIEIYVDRPSSSWIWQSGEVEMATKPLDIENLLAERKELSWKGLPDKTIIGHIHLHVSELIETEQFYSQGLGFQIVNKYGNQAIFISTGGYHHHIGLNTWNGVGAPVPPDNSVGLERFTLVLPNKETMAQKVRQLQLIGAILKEEKGHIITKDPSGNKIELLVSIGV